jgi:two-component system, LytTR family, response regulator LytT
MHILIVEDERPIAEDIMMLTKQILKERIASIHIETTLDNALAYINEKRIDLLLLDLNMNAKDGFDILKNVVSKSFLTIIVSANSDRAIEAFEYGVLDFIPKPYNLERLKSAFNRFDSDHSLDGHSIKFLSVKKGFEIQVIPLREINYFKAINIYVELHLKNGKVEIYDKSLKKLACLLPSNYIRIHKSYIINIDLIDKVKSFGGGQFSLILKSNDTLPISRLQIASLKKLLDL